MEFPVKPNRIEFIFIEGKSFWSKMIEFFTRSKFSHVAYINDKDEVVTTGETRHGNCWHYEDIKTFVEREGEGSKYIILGLDVDHVRYLCVNHYMNSLAKRKVRYNWLGVIAFVLKLRRISDKKKFCSQGCMDAIQMCFGNLCDSNIKAQYVSPEMFYMVLRAMGANIVDKGVL